MPALNPTPTAVPHRYACQSVRSTTALLDAALCVDVLDILQSGVNWITVYLPVTQWQLYQIPVKLAVLGNVCVCALYCSLNPRVRSLMYTLTDNPDGREFNKDELKVRTHIHICPACVCVGPIQHWRCRPALP